MEHFGSYCHYRVFVVNTASVVFVSALISEKRRILAAYPVFLFYVVIAWMILLQ